MRIERVAKGDTAVTADTALRLSPFCGNQPEFGMNLQHARHLNKAAKRQIYPASGPCRRPEKNHFLPLSGDADTHGGNKLSFKPPA